MAKTIDLRIATALDPKGLSAATTGIQQLQSAAKSATRDMQALVAALKQVDGLSRNLPKMPTGGGGGSGGGPTSSVLQLERAQASLEQQQAALARAQGDGAKAAQLQSQAQERLSNVLAQQTTTTTQTIGVQRQLVAMQTQVAKQAQGGSSYFQQFGDAMRGSMLSIIGPAAAAQVAIKAVGEAVELTKLGAQATQTKQAFDGLATSAGTTGDALLGALRKASAGTISDLNLELAANKAQLLGVADSAAEFSTLMEIARDRAQKMGIGTAQAFDNLVTGLGRGSPLILDNLGITLSVTEANNAYAASIGTTASKLTEAQQKQALINAVLTQGRASIAASGGAMNTMATDVERASASWDNLKVKIGQALGTLVAPTLNNANTIASIGDQIGQASQQAFAGAKSFDDYGRRVTFVNEQLGGLSSALNILLPGLGKAVAPIQGLTEAQYAYAQALMKTGDSADEAFSKAQKFGELFGQVGRVQQELADDATLSADAQDELINKLVQVGTTVPESATAIDTLSGMFIRGRLTAEEFSLNLDALNASHNANVQAAALDRIETEHLNATNQTAGQIAAAFKDELTQLTGMSTESANASMIDSQAKETQQLQMQLLTAQTDQAVAGFLRLNPNIDEAGIAALKSAGQVPPLIAILAALQLQADRTRASLAWLNGGQAQQDFRAGERGLGSAAPGSAQQSYQASQKAREAALALAEAQRQQILTTGTASQKLTQLKTDLDKATASYGANSAEAVKAQTALTQFQQSQARSSGGRGAKGGGAGAKLDKIRTDEYQKTEDAELQHQKRLLDIQEDYEKKSLAQAKENEIAKRASRADFYDKLTQSTKDIGGDVAQELSAEYEQTFAQAREMEQKGNYQQAEDFRKAKQKQLDEELNYQKDVADVRKDADMAQADKDAELSRLAAIHQLRQDELNEELKQVTEGGDAINQARQKALDDENLRYEEQLGKIADTSDRKAAAVNRGLASQSAAAARWAADMESSADRVKRALEGVPDSAGGGGSSAASGGNTNSGSANTGSGGASSSASSGSSAKTTQNIRMGQQSRGGRDNGGGSSPGQGSGGGAQNVTDAGAALTEANAVIMQIVQAGTVDKKTLSQLERYQDTIATATAVLSRIADIRAQLARVGPPIPSSLIQELANEAQKVATIVAGTITTEALRSKDAILKWSEISEKTIGVLKSAAELRKDLVDVAPPIDASVVEQLAQEITDVTSIVLGSLLATTDDQKKALQRYGDAAEAAIKPLSDIVDLREALAEPQPALTGAVVAKLAKEVQGVLYLVSQNLIPTSEEEAAAMQHYADAATAAIGALAAVADLREQAEKTGSPLTRAIVEKLAKEAQGVLYLVSQNMLPVSEETAAAIQQYADAASSAIDLLTGVIDLRQALAEPTAPLTAADIQPLADEAALALQVLEASLIPVTQDEADAIGRYADAAGAAIDLFKGVADLRASVKDLASPLRTEDLERLADEGRRAYEVLSKRVIPVSEDEAKAIQDYADTVGAAVEALKAPLDLSGSLFADYVSPSDAQLDLLAADAGRVADRLLAAAKVYDTKGLEAGKAYAEAVGGTFAAYKDGLLFFDALNSGDFTLDSAKLAQFEDGVGQALQVADRLGALAATIPAGNIAALNGATSALSQAAQTMVDLSAVSYDNLSAALSSLGAGSGGGGGSSTTTNYFSNTFVLPNGTTQQMANEIMGIVKQQMQSRR